MNCAKINPGVQLIAMFLCRIGIKSSKNTVMLMCWCRLKALTDIAVLNVCNGIICSRSMMHNEAFSALEDFFILLNTLI